ncbi:hypothetical protein [Neorhizobium sp. NCHU2750]|uniref:hypothetical protein n=1 Tax=Neorhizobium sp. NCHU2750 TaxID=1825976 RepID=UPI000E745600|nr:hypothetical protein NCHU2750_06240 [Neorhizobium sp. NCHU2750]
MSFDGKAFGAEIVGVVKGYIAKEMATLLTRLDALEKRVEALPPPVDLSADLVELKTAVGAIVMPHAPELPDVGKMIEVAIADSASEGRIRTIVEESVRRYFSEIPKPKDGKDGASVTADDLAPMIATEVERRFAAFPKPKDGKDGLDVREMLRAEGGHLIAVMSDGTTRDLGVFVGKDGEPGKPGKDGFNLEDFEAAVMDDGRTVLLSFDRGDLSYKVELGFDVMLYRGVFKDGHDYVRGDTVTWGGSLWHCDQPTSEKPGDGSKSWTLCAKKGRDGKDGEVKEARAVQSVRVGVPAEGV